MKVAAALLALGFLVPVHELPWTGFLGDLCAAACLLLLALQSPAVRWPAASLAVLGLALVPLVQHATGLVHFRGDAVMAALYLTGLALAIQVGAQAGFASAGTGRLLAGAVLAAALLSSLIAVAVAAGWASPGGWIGPQARDGRAVANLAQPNLLASLLALGLLVLLARWPTTRPAQALSAAAAVLLIGTLALTGSRTGLLECALLLTVGLLAPHRLGLGLARRGLAALLALLGIAVLATPWLQQGTHRGWLQADSISARGDYARLFASAVQESPWLGHGFNQVSVAQARQAVHPHPPAGWTEHSHNLLLDLMLWCGMPLAALVVVGLSLLLWRGLRRLPGNPSLGPVLLAVMLLLVHAMLEYPLAYFIFLLPFGLLLGRLSAGGLAAPVPRAAGRAVIAVCALVLLTVVADYRRITPALASARAALQVPVAGIGEAPPVLLLDQLRAQHDMALYLGHAHTRPADLAALEAATERFAYLPVISRLAADARSRGDLAMATRLDRRLLAMGVPHSGDITPAPARPPPAAP